MRKFLFKILCLTAAVTAAFFWFESDGGILADSSPLGLDDSNGWLTGHSQDSKSFDVLESIHSSMLRVEMPWNEVEPSAGAFVWSYQSETGFVDYKAIFSRLEKRGIQPVVILDGGPVYLSSLYPQQPVSAESLLENWQNYVSAAVQQFGSQVDYWQIGGVINDPAYWGSLLYPLDEGAQAEADLELYAKMLKSAYTIIKSSGAGDMVILGELALNGDCAQHPLFYLQNINEKEAWYDFDTVAIRLSALDDAPDSAVVDTCGFNSLQPSGVALADPVKAIGEFMGEIKPKPVWVTNLSLSQDLLSARAAERTSLPEVVESDYLARASGLLLAYGGADRIFWRYAPQDGQPAVIALQSFANLSQTLSANATQENAGASADFKVLRFRKNGKLAIMAWRTQGGDEAQALVIPGVAGYKLKAYSTDTESLKASKGVKMNVDAGGSTALMVSERPILISGKLSNIKESLSAMLADNYEQASRELQNRLTGWVQVQKNKAADQVGNWVAKQQASLLDILRSSFQQWIRQSLGLAKK